MCTISIIPDLNALLYKYGTCERAVILINLALHYLQNYITFLSFWHCYSLISYNKSNIKLSELCIFINGINLHNIVVELYNLNTFL